MKVKGLSQNVLRKAGGDRGLYLDDLIVFFYQRLHLSAKVALYDYRGHESIQATELVSELYCHFRSRLDYEFTNSGEFFAFASFKLRQLLKERYRKKSAQKRSYGNRVDENLIDLERNEPGFLEFMMVKDVIEELDRIDPMAARLVELKVFWGMTDPEASDVLDLSESTVYRRWSWSKAWLLKSYQMDCL